MMKLGGMLKRLGKPPLWAFHLCQYFTTKKQHIIEVNLKLS